MDNLEHLRLAREKRSQLAKEQRNSVVFTLCFRGGGVSEIVGYKALAAYLHIKETSIPVLLSKGAGVITLERTNPQTNESDILSIVRAPIHKPKPKRGRPSKRIIDNARMGAEFVENDSTETPKSPHKRKPE